MLKKEEAALAQEWSCSCGYKH